VNTQLIYRCKQLERVKETLEAAWMAHKRLHQAAGLDVSDVDSTLLQTYNFRSSVCHPAGASVREPRFSRSASPLLASPQADDPVLLSVSRCPEKPSFTTRQCCGAGDDFHCRAWSESRSTAVQQQVVGSNCSAASKRTNCIEFSDCDNDEWTAKQYSDDLAGYRQLTFPPESSSVLDCIDDVSGSSAVIDPMSAVLDANQRSVDRSTPSANDDDDDSFQSLFGSDNWWSSEHTWRWYCDSPASAIEEANRTLAEIGSAKSNGCSVPSLLRVNDTATGTFRHHERQFIPLHVEGLVDDACCQWQETLDI